MNSKIAVAVLLGSALVGCAKSQPAARGRDERDGTSPPSHAPASADASAPAVVPVKAAPRPPLVPLATGKPVRIDGLDNDMAPLEIAVPPKFRLKIVTAKGTHPTAHIVGPDVELIVGPPQEGFSSLTTNQEMILKGDPTATFVRTEETEVGFLMIDIHETGPDRTRKYKTTVSRPNLKVECGAAGPLEKLSDAEQVAAICLTLRAASVRTPN